MTKCITIILLLVSVSSYSQQAQPAASPSPAPAPAYGEPVNLETAKKIVAASENYARDKKWAVVIVVVDTGGNLVLIHKLDNTQIGSIDVAIGKARTANNFKRPTKAFEDAIAGGGIGLRVLTLPNAVTIEGGEPILVDGKVVGAIGVSGVQASQDGEVAKAGLAALSK
jgi:glc operon protein GlcG